MKKLTKRDQLKVNILGYLKIKNWKEYITDEGEAFLRGISASDGTITMVPSPLYDELVEIDKKRIATGNKLYEQKRDFELKIIKLEKQLKKEKSRRWF